MKNSLLLLGLLALSTKAHADDCTAGWELFDSQPRREIALPDNHVTYWRYRVALPNTHNTALKLSGEFPHGRYMTFNVYDQQTIDSAGSLPDYAIAPDAGSTNPFVIGADRDAKIRNYTAWIVPSDSDNKDRNNVLAMPVSKDSETLAIEIWYRIYVPAIDSNGGVSLPKIEAVDDLTGEPTLCPLPYRRAFPPLGKGLKSLPPVATDGEIATYRSSGSGLYANADNMYIAARLPMSRRDWGYRVRFKAPTFYRDTSKAPISGNEDVRYWSLCTGTLTTITIDCLADYNAKIDADGFVDIVIAPEAFRKRAEARGLNFLEAAPALGAALIYRNLLSNDNFAGNMRKVPVWNSAGGILGALLAAPDEFAAHRFIGDFAPRGAYCAIEDFQDLNCR